VNTTTIPAIQLKSLMYASAFFLTVLNYLDFVTTKIIIETGLGYEMNPMLAFFIEQSGTVYSILFAKGIAFAILWIAILIVNRKSTIIKTIIMVLLSSVVYSIVVTRSLIMLYA